MNNTTKILSGLGFGTIATLVLATGVLKPTVKLVALSTLVSVPVIGVANEVIQSRADKRVKVLEDKLGIAQQDSHKLAAATADNDRLSLYQASLKSELSQLQDLVASLKAENTNLKESQQLQLAQLQVLRGEKEKLTEQIVGYEETYSSELESEVQQRVSEYITSDRALLDAKYRSTLMEGQAIHAEAVAIAYAYEEWAEQIGERHVERKNYILGLTKEFNHHIGGAQEDWETERGHLITQIEVLTEKIARLQQKLAGDLTEPEYGQFGYAIEGKIANDIARYVWDTLQIPLAVKGYSKRSDGAVDVGYSYARSIPLEALHRDLNRHSEDIAKTLRIHKISSIRKLEIADLLVLTYRREPAIKQDEIKLLVGSSEEFLNYLKNNPWRYRLIAKPGTGKTPTTAVMVSQFLKSGMTLGNTGRGKKIPFSQVVVSCPDVLSSQKDIDYPLQPFLKYGETTAANKSFQDVKKEWEYRKQNTHYAKEISFLMVWDELDNTINSASDPKATGEYLRTLLKQAHHTGMGWIVSGQSLMTSQIPGFKDDDRELFTEIIIGVGKIRTYLEKYGKKLLSKSTVDKLLASLNSLESYIETKNSQIPDTARELRLALVLDQKSPKLFFLPNLDNVNFDIEKVEYVITKVAQMKTQFMPNTRGQVKGVLGSDSCNSYNEPVTELRTAHPNLTIGGDTQNTQNAQKPFCPHCGGSNLKVVENGKRYQCGVCKTPSGRSKRIDSKKVVWR